MKVVINRCCGGFSISKEAAEHMAANGSERAKLELNKFKEQGEWYGFGNVKGMSGGYDRTDPLLVKAVEELGDAADGAYAELKVVTIPDDIEWEIDDYDGKERIEERHNSWS